MDQQYQKLELKIEKLCGDIVECHDKSFPILAGNLRCYPQKGQKFIKIILESNQRSVWGFINIKHQDFKFGDVLKSKSWKAPALNKARGNLLEQDYEISGMRQYGPDYLI